MDRQEDRPVSRGERESLTRCCLEEHGGPDTLFLHRQSLGGAVDAAKLRTAWAARGNDAAPSPGAESSGWSTREKAMRHLGDAFKANGFRDAWLLPTMFLLDRVWASFGPDAVRNSGQELAVWLLTVCLVALKCESIEAETKLDMQEIVVDKLGVHLLKVKTEEFKHRREKLWKSITKAEVKLLLRFQWHVAKSGPGELSMRLAIGAVVEAERKCASGVVPPHDTVTDACCFFVESALTQAPEVSYGDCLPPMLLALASAGFALQAVMMEAKDPPPMSTPLAVALEFLKQERMKLQELMTPAQRGCLEPVVFALLQLWQQPSRATQTLRKWSARNQGTCPAKAKLLCKAKSRYLSSALADALGVDVGAPPPTVQIAEPASLAVLSTPPACLRPKSDDAWTPEPKSVQVSESLPTAPPDEKVSHKAVTPSKSAAQLPSEVGKGDAAAVPGGATPAGSTLEGGPQGNHPTNPAPSGPVVQSEPQAEKEECKSILETVSAGYKDVNADARSMSVQALTSLAEKAGAEHSPVRPGSFASPMNKRSPSKPVSEPHVEGAAGLADGTRGAQFLREPTEGTTKIGSGEAAFEEVGLNQQCVGIQAFKSVIPELHRAMYGDDKDEVDTLATEKHDLKVALQAQKDAFDHAPQEQHEALKKANDPLESVAVVRGSPSEAAGRGSQAAASDPDLLAAAPGAAIILPQPTDSRMQVTSGDPPASELLARNVDHEGSSCRDIGGTEQQTLSSLKDSLCGREKSSASIPGGAGEKSRPTEETQPPPAKTKLQPIRELTKDQNITVKAIFKMFAPGGFIFMKQLKEVLRALGFDPDKVRSSHPSSAPRSYSFLEFADKDVFQEIVSECSGGKEHIHYQDFKRIVEVLNVSGRDQKAGTSKPANSAATKADGKARNPFRHSEGAKVGIRASVVTAPRVGSTQATASQSKPTSPRQAHRSQSAEGHAQPAAVSGGSVLMRPSDATNPFRKRSTAQPREASREVAKKPRTRPLIVGNWCYQDEKGCLRYYSITERGNKLYFKQEEFGGYLAEASEGFFEGELITDATKNSKGFIRLRAEPRGGVYSEWKSAKSLQWGGKHFAKASIFGSWSYTKDGNEWHYCITKTDRGIKFEQRQIIEGDLLSSAQCYKGHLKTKDGFYRGHIYENGELLGDIRCKPVAGGVQSNLKLAGLLEITDDEDHWQEPVLARATYERSCDNVAPKVQSGKTARTVEASGSVGAPETKRRRTEVLEKS